MVRVPLANPSTCSPPRGRTLLFLACARGEHYDNVVLKGVRRAKGNALQEYFTLKLTEVIVSSISIGGAAGDGRQTENVTLNFAKVEITVRKQNADGSLGAPVTTTWNIATNTP